MTDKEIRKALERCSTTYNCGDCPYYCDAEDCPGPLMNDALDLINRQKAEIEELRKRISYLEKSIDCSRKEYNRLLQKLQQAKSEALMHAFSKFAGHSDYHGDTILCQLACMAEGKETKSAVPIDTNQIKSEAIKEFAKRLKEKCYEDFQETYEMLSPYVTDDDIDNLVKEMTEENK